MAVNIVTGMTGIEHITSHDDRARNASQFGRGKYVFNIGRKFSATAVDDNLVRIQDGMCINQGTQMGIEPNDYADVEIDNGLLGTNRHDIIVMRYEKNEETLLEKASLVVVKGVNSSEPVDPDITEGNILDGGDLVDDMPLYRVIIEGVNLVSIEPLFEVFDGDVGSILEELDDKVNKVTGKGLSTNDYTNEDKTKLDGIDTGAEVNVQSDWSQNDNTADDFIKHKPGIPSKTSDLQNDSDFVSDANYVHTDNNYTNADKEDVAKIDTIETNQTQILSDIEDLEHSLSTTKTATGNPISISDSAHVNAEGLIVTLEPIQSGSGDPSPENIRPISGYDETSVVRSGKNLLPMTVDGIKAANTSGTWSGNAYTLNGVTFTAQTDADGNVTGIKVTGTASTNTRLYTYLELDNANSYILTGTPSGGSENAYFQRVSNTAVTVYSVDTGNGATIQANANVTKHEIIIISGYAIPTAGLMFYPMIRLATESDSTYEPYTADTYTLQFGDTVYGAEVDFVSGVATVKYGYESITQVTESSDFREAFTIPIPSNMKITNNDRTIPTNAICNQLQVLDITSVVFDSAIGLAYSTTSGVIFTRFPSSVGTTEADVNNYLASNPIQLCYELTQPYTIQLTPQQIKMLKGNNVLVADGDMNLTYQVDSVVGDVKEWAENEFLPKASATAQHNYSTQEQVVGTWIDGSTLYEKSWILSASVTIVYNSWTSLGITYTGIDKIVYSEANNESMANVSIISDASNDDIRVMGFRNDSGVTVKYLTLRYTKTAE